MSDEDPPSSQLFAVMVRSHGASWRVLVRAATEEEARINVEARGHEVVSVGPGTRPTRREWDQPTVCPVCSYSLRGVKKGEHGLIQCPECGIVATPPDDSIIAIARQRFGRARQAPLAPRGCLVGIGLMIFIILALYLYRTFF